MLCLKISYPQRIGVCAGYRPLSGGAVFVLTGADVRHPAPTHPVRAHAPPLELAAAGVVARALHLLLLQEERAVVDKCGTRDAALRICS